MAPPPAVDQLADKLYVSVILRLLLGSRGELEHGELVDTDGTLRGRFRDWDGLTALLRAWLRTHAPAAGDQPSPGNEE